MPFLPADAVRLSVRPLLPGPDGAVREEVLRLGGGVESLPALARHAAVEALAMRGLAPDEARILQREASRLGLTLVTDARGARGVLMGPLAVVAALPTRLLAFGRRGEAMGSAIRACLAGKGTPPPHWRAGRYLLPTGRRTLVMGVVNATPDSFSGDGTGDGSGGGVEAAVARGLAMVAEGADILDVGGESTRPNATPVDEAEELRRALPVVARLAAEAAVPVSIDTRKSAVAVGAIAAGAVVVNDIWGLRGDGRMAEVCASADVGVVLMHNQRGTEYGGMLEEIVAALRESIVVGLKAGITPDRMCVDPGFGFGKTPAQNLEVVRRLGELRGIGRPILAGVSRKSTIGLVLRRPDGSPAPPEERVEGGIALAVLCAAAGAAIIRTHDVAATVRALRLADAVLHGTPDSLLVAPAPGPTG